MFETLRCPSCSTRYELHPYRVRAGIRRALCFRCGTAFDIEPAVTRLLAPLQDGVPPERPPSLNLGDLEAAAASPYATSGVGYSSARDAIEKLMGNAPRKRAPAEDPGPGAAIDPEMEATLSALGTTFGADPVSEAQPASDSQQSNMTSTVKLTSQEILAALSAPSPALPAAPPPTPRAEYKPRLENPPAAQSPTQDQDLLKVQLEQETCNNVTLEQMAAWIEQGRVREFHMVARQFSEHWIEANKVPALRSIFDQKRARGYAPRPEDLPIPPVEILPPKKGLFGGFFSRN